MKQYLVLASTSIDTRIIVSKEFTNVSTEHFGTMFRSLGFATDILYTVRDMKSRCPMTRSLRVKDIHPRRTLLKILYLNNKQHSWPTLKSWNFKLYAVEIRQATRVLGKHLSDKLLSSRSCPNKHALLDPHYRLSSTTALSSSPPLRVGLDINRVATSSRAAFSFSAAAITRWY